MASAPWPVGAVLGASILLGGLYLLPALLAGSANPFLSALAAAIGRGGLNPLLWLLAGACWLAALLSAVSAHRRRQLLDRQASLSDLRNLSWRQFEQLVGEAFRRQGFAVEETGQHGPDGGIDLMLRRGEEHVLVQCKQWRTQRVGVNIVREQYGLLAHHGASRAVIVTVGDFTPDAQSFAAGKPITLVNGEALLQLVAAVQQAPPGEDRGRAPIEPIPEPSLPDRHTAAQPSCPRCSAPMVERTSRDRGTRFYGCSKFPACRGTRQIEAH